MSKKTVTGEDGKTYTVKEKKPWYKRFWVWLLIIVVIIIGASAMGGSSNDSSSSSDSDTEKTSSKAKSSPLDKTYKVGQTVTYNGYSFKVNKVNYYDGDGDVDTPDKDGDQFVIANVTITNKGDEKQDYNPYDFQLNADGNSTDFDGTIVNGQYANNDLDSGTLDKGASVSGNLVGEAKPDAKLKLEYKPSFWDDKTVDVTLR